MVTRSIAFLILQQLTTRTDSRIRVCFILVTEDLNIYRSLRIGTSNQVTKSKKQAPEDSLRVVNSFYLPQKQAEEKVLSMVEIETSLY